MSVVENSSYTTAIDSNYELVSQTLPYDRIYDYYLSNADSATFLNSFTTTGVKVTLPDGSPNQSGTVAHSNAANTVIANAIRGAVRSSSITLEDDLLSDFGTFLGSIAGGFSDNNKMYAITDARIPQNEITLTLATVGGTITDYSGRVDNAVGDLEVRLADNTLLQQIPAANLGVYQAATTNSLTTDALPAQKGQSMVIGVQVSVSNVSVTGSLGAKTGANSANIPTPAFNTINIVESKTSLTFTAAFRLWFGNASSGTVANLSSGAFAVGSSAGQLRAHA